jgi:uncharacterized protein YodC (DUF2158 family)
MTFKVGETVQLKSGGPIMTVKKESTAEESVICQWFDKTDVKQAAFPEASLEHAEP